MSNIRTRIDRLAAVVSDPPTSAEDMWGDELRSLVDEFTTGKDHRGNPVDYGDSYYKREAKGALKRWSKRWNEYAKAADTLHKLLERMAAEEMRELEDIKRRLRKAGLL